MRPRTAQATPPRIGPWQLWFAVLAAPTAWALHEVFAWSTVELACLGGNRTLVFPPLVWAGIATAVPWAVSGTALIMAVVLRRRTRAQPDDTPSLQRVRLMVTVAVVLDVLMLLIITGGGVGEIVLGGC